MGIAIEKLLELPVVEKIELAIRLWESISEKDKDIVISEQDEIELQKRLEKHYKYPEKGKNWEVLKKELNI